VEWNVLPTQGVGHATERSSDRVTARGALTALALGALLSSVGVLCSQWIGNTPLLCIAFQSAFAMMVFGITTSARPKDLTLDTQSMETCPETSHSSAHGARELYRLGIAAQPMSVAS
jgi:hypothetical protein